MRPGSTGKGLNEYVAAANTKLDRATFCKALREFLSKQQFATNVDESQIHALYEISLDHHRHVNATEEIRRDKLAKDWNHRKKLIANTKAKLAATHGVLHAAAIDKKWPSTAEFADAVLIRLIRFQKSLDREILDIETRQRAQAAMIKARPLKTMRDTYVGELYRHIVRTFHNLPTKNRQVLIAAAMYGAREFSPKEVADDVLARIPMMISRAKVSLDRETLDDWDV